MKRFLAIFLTAILLLTSNLALVAGATSSKSTANEDKITDELKEVMAEKKNNEYISIYIWLYDMGDEVVYSQLSKEHNDTIEPESETEYINKQIEEKIEKYEKTQLDNEKEKALLKYEKMSEIEKIISFKN